MAERGATASNPKGGTMNTELVDGKVDIEFDNDVEAFVEYAKAYKVKDLFKRTENIAHTTLVIPVSTYTAVGTGQIYLTISIEGKENYDGWFVKHGFRVLRGQVKIRE